MTNIFVWSLVIFFIFLVFPLLRRKKDHEKVIKPWAVLESSNVIQFDGLGYPLRLVITNEGNQVWMDTLERENDIILKWEDGDINFMAESSRRGKNPVKEYLFEWKEMVEKSVNIIASSKEEAHQKWLDGDYGETDINTSENIGESILIDQESHYADNCIKIDG